VPHGGVGPGTFRGFDDVLEQLWDSWPNVLDVLIADEILEAGDQVVVVWQFRYADAIDETRIRVISFKDGKMWRIKEYPTRGEALEAAGLSE
jgi:hypothetical protein